MFEDVGSHSTPDTNLYEGTRRTRALRWSRVTSPSSTSARASSGRFMRPPNRVRLMCLCWKIVLNSRRTYLRGRAGCHCHRRRHASTRRRVEWGERTPASTMTIPRCAAYHAAIRPSPLTNDAGAGLSGTLFFTVCSQSRRSMPAASLPNSARHSVDTSAWRTRCRSGMRWLLTTIAGFFSCTRPLLS